MILRSRHSRVRVVASAAVVTATVLSLAACAPPQDDTLVITIWGSETDKSVFQERLDLAEEAIPDLDVELVQISENYDTKLQTMFAGGKAPDVLMIAEGVNVLSSKKQLLDQTPLFEKAGIDPVEQFGQGSVDTYSTDGSLWAAPDRAGAAVLYYNKDIFDAQGVEYPSADWTWDDFRDAAQRLTVRDGDAVQSYGYAAGDWWPWYLTWMEQNGGAILDESGAPIANSPENVEALEFYNDMVLEDRSAPSPIDYANEGLSNGQPDPLFAQGKLAMEVTGFWNIASLNQTDLNWDIAPLWHGAEAAVPAFGSALAISSSTSQPDKAAELVQFLTSAEGQAPLASSGLDVPANLEAVASDAFQQPDWNTKGVNLAAFTDSAENIYSPPLVPEWNEIQKAFTDGLDAAWKGEESMQAGLDRVQASLENILR